MKTLKILVLSCLVFAAACRQFDIPEVDTVVNEILATYSSHVHQHGNHTKAGAQTVLERQSTPYWYEQIAHRGISAFGPGGYVVYRNVKDYGARGDGVTDDTAAINAAISAGGRCGRGCAATSTTPAVVYFPSGTYLLSSSIVDYYYTQLIGNPNDLPVLKARAGFEGFGIIDGNPYYTENLNWGSTNVFLRQVRNFVFDLTGIPATTQATGIHWPTSQATSLQNIVFQMSAAPGTRHTGLFCESGSAGFMTDITFNGGIVGASVGNQQFTMRNLVFNNCVTAISMLWNWGWVYQGISINNCQTGIDISAGGSSAQNVGSLILIDSSITNTPVGIITAYTFSSLPRTAGSLILENVVLTNVRVTVQLNTGRLIVPGTTGTATIVGWGEGHEYSRGSGPHRFQSTLNHNSRPASLLNGGKYYTQSKPQYNNLPVSSFQSTRSCGAAGNGVQDDTYALQQCINDATAAGRIVFFDAGTYKVTSTLTIPPGARMVGESFSTIMSSGSFFNNMASPQAVVRVGRAGDTGIVEWSDMMISTQGTQAGAILIEWNLASPSGSPSGMWDVHTRIGGFAGSNQSLGQCPAIPGSRVVNTACIAAYMSMHITRSASGLYMENIWLWSADHDFDDGANKQITLYSGRGLLIESAVGNIWLVGTASEHHVLYQYQFINTQNIYAGFLQTETPYYQPLPSAPAPFTLNPTLHDPTFALSTPCPPSTNCYNAWALRIVNSQNILIYGAGLYSFFNDYSTTCSNNPGPRNCQRDIVSLEGRLDGLSLYCLSTVGTTNMVLRDGSVMVLSGDNANVYPQTVAIVRL